MAARARVRHEVLRVHDGRRGGRGDGAQGRDEPLPEARVTDDGDERRARHVYLGVTRALRDDLSDGDLG